jgi:foldase protein PrsA
MLKNAISTRRRLLACAAPIAAAAGLAISGCGDDVPSNGVAKVGDTVIKKDEFNHWFNAAAKQQAQATGGGAAVVVPDPPDFTKCSAARMAQKVPKGVPKPTAASAKTQCKQEYDGLKQQTMQFLISSQWLIQEAEKRDVKASDAEVKKTFEDQKKQSFPKDKDYQEFLKTSGQTEADLLYRVRLSVLTNSLQQKIVEGKDKVSDKQVSDYYNKNKARFAQPETRDLEVVLATKKANADKALKELEDGASFKTVAKKYSTDDASKSKGGKLPGVTKGQQEKAFDAAIFSAKKGEIQGPVKTQFGYYVFRVTKVTAAKQQPLSQVSETIKNQLKSQQQQKALNDFVKDFQDNYKEETNCAKGFVVEQCKNAPKPKTDTNPASGAAPGQTPQQGAPQQVPPGTPGQVPQQGAPQQGAPQQVPPQQVPPQQAPPAAP